MKKDFFLKGINYVFQGILFASISLENYMKVVLVDMERD